MGCFSYLHGRKVNAVIRANDALFDDGDLFSIEKLRDVSYEIASAEKLAHLDDGSVDYVFTDPPFGSNIFYSDMNLFQEAWLGKTTDHAREAVVHTTGKRKNGSRERYEELLRGAFSEAFRVLKPDRYMSVVFGNSSGRIWGLVQRALRDAGFKASPVHVATLDKRQRSVKGLNSGSEGVVTVDLIVTMQKPAQAEGAGKAATLANGHTDALIRAAIDELSADEARNPSHVYARILAWVPPLQAPKCITMTEKCLPSVQSRTDLFPYRYPSIPLRQRRSVGCFTYPLHDVAKHPGDLGVGARHLVPAARPSARACRADS